MLWLHKTVLVNFNYVHLTLPYFTTVFSAVLVSSPNKHCLFISGGYFHGITSLTFGVDLERIRWLGILQVNSSITRSLVSCWLLLYWKLIVQRNVSDVVVMYDSTSSLMVDIRTFFLCILFEVANEFDMMIYESRGYLLDTLLQLYARFGFHLLDWKI